MTLNLSRGEESRTVDALVVGVVGAVDVFDLSRAEEESEEESKSAAP